MPTLPRAPSGFAWSLIPLAPTDTAVATIDKAAVASEPPQDTHWKPPVEPELPNKKAKKTAVAQPEIGEMADPGSPRGPPVHAFTIDQLVGRPFGRTTLYRLIGENAFPVRKLGTRTFILASDWAAFLKSCPSGTAPPPEAVAARRRQREEAARRRQEMREEEIEA